MTDRTDNVIEFKSRPPKEYLEAVVWDRQIAIPKPFWEWVTQASNSPEQVQWVKEEVRKPCKRYFGAIRNHQGLLAVHNANTPGEMTIGVEEYVRNWWRSFPERDEQAVPPINYPEWSQVKSKQRP